MPLQIGLLSRKVDFENAKSNLTNVKNPVWNLMMKKYLSGAYQVKQEDFRFNILYTDRPVKLYY
jgi:cell surface protein SprA